MRKLIYAFSVSLDGYIEGPNGDLDWSTPDAEEHQHFNDMDRALGGQLYGRRLYELMSAFWPTADQDPSEPEVIREYARIWRAMPKYVFSTTLKNVEWNSTLVNGDTEQAVRKLKDQPGRDLSVGGASLANSMLRLGLIDECWLYLRPVILGGGKPMFGPLPAPIKLSLLETRHISQRLQLLRYQVAAS